MTRSHENPCGEASSRSDYPDSERKVPVTSMAIIGEGDVAGRDGAASVVVDAFGIGREPGAVGVAHAVIAVVPGFDGFWWRFCGGGCASGESLAHGGECGVLAKGCQTIQCVAS